MNKPKVIGTAWETAICRYLQAEGIDCERAALSGALDRGDLTGPGLETWMIEAKSHREITLAGYMDEVEAQKRNAKKPFGCAIVKRRGKGVERAYVIMELGQFSDLLRDGDW